MSEYWLVDIENPAIRGHLVMGQHVLPGLAYVDLLYQVFRHDGYDHRDLELRNLTIFHPLTVAEDRSVLLDIQRLPQGEGAWRVCVDGELWCDGKATGERRRYVEAEMHRAGEPEFNETVDLVPVVAAAREIISLADLYASYRLKHLSHDAFMQAQGQLYAGDSATHLICSLGDAAKPGAEKFMFHPALLDGAAACGGASIFGLRADDAHQQLALPIFYESFRASQLLQGQCVVRIKRSSVRVANELMYCTVEFFNAGGNKVAELKNIAAKLMRAAASADFASASAEPSPSFASTTSVPSSAHAVVERADIERWLRELISEKVRQPAARTDVKAGYYELGLQSADLLELARIIEGRIGRTLSPTLLFEHVTIEQLAMHLAANGGRLSPAYAATRLDALAAKHIREHYVFQEHERFLQEHLVFGQPALMGVTCPSLVIEAYAAAVGSHRTFELRNIRFYGGPITLAKNESTTLSVEILPSHSARVFRVEHTKGSDATVKPCCDGSIADSASGEPELVDLDRLLRGARALTAGEIEAIYHRTPHMAIGPLLRTIEAAWVVEGSRQIMKVRLDDRAAKGGMRAFRLDPLSLCSCYHLHAGTAATAAERIAIPLAIERLQLRGTVPTAFYIVVEWRTQRDDYVAFDAKLVAASGELVASIENASVKQVEDPSSLVNASFEKHLAPQRADERGEPATQTRKEGIAIVGVAGRYPQASDVAEFWSNLLAGKDCITEIPASRWDWREQIELQNAGAAKVCSRWGGFIDGVDEFDPLFFNIAPRDAHVMDPQERMFLQCAYQTLEDAGYTREALNASRAPGVDGNVGVFVGVMYEEYQLYGAQAQAFGQPQVLGGSPASIANRVSYFCDFHGPSVAVDTMCSSSLTAIHFACESLRTGACEVAIAGGVNVSVHPNKYLMLSQGQFASVKGRCESFGRGDGYVPGEGVGAVLLKPLAKAIADGDFVYGVIRATSVNHGGRTNGYTAPNPVAQREVIQAALRKAQIDARAVSYIEAHGTGTSLGDPIEISGLTQAFAKYSSDKQYCAIGSVKSNIGHLESASGIAGLTKVLLQMQHRMLVPSLHSEELNPHIDFANTPFKVQREVSPWQRPRTFADGVVREQPLIAGISSFGAGGANAHIIVEEHAPSRAETGALAAGNLALIVLSARDEERLRERASRLVAFLEARNSTDEQLADVAYTLQVGREPMSHRLAFTAQSIAEVQAKLRRYLSGGVVSGEGIHVDRSSRDEGGAALLSISDELDDIARSWRNPSDLERLLELWTKGYAFDWERLYEPTSRYAVRRPRRVPLPPYSFEKRKFWFHPDRSAMAVKSRDSKAAPVAQPNKAAEFYSLAAHGIDAGFNEEYLTFCPFEKKVPSFSMTRYFLNPALYPEEHRLVQAKQRELRQVLFCREDFQRIGRVLDIGCGHGTDVIQLASRYGHLRTDGFTITKDQQILGSRRIAELGLGERARIFNKDSSQDPFPGHYDLVIGIEVTFHIRNKEGLFRNIASSLASGGRVLLMDFIANLQGPIADESVEVTIPTNSGWIELLANHGFLIDEVIDVSREIANYSHDPQFEQHTRDLPQVMQDTLRVYVNQSVALERGWISYVLMKLCRAPDRSREEIVAHNAAKLAAKRPYADARAEMLALAPDCYPAIENGSGNARRTRPQVEHGMAYSTEPDAFELMTFRETWVPRPLGAAFRSVRTIVCMASDAHHRRAIAHALRAMPSVRVTFVADSGSDDEGTCAFDRSDSRSLEEVFARIRADVGEIDVLLDLTVLEVPERIRSYAGLVMLFQSLAASKLRCHRVIAAAQSLDGIDRCHVESWLAIERSIKQVLAQTQFAVLFEEKNAAAVDANAWAQRMLEAARSEKLESAMFLRGTRHVLQIEQTPAPDACDTIFSAGAAYLITGGMGGIGFQFAKHIAKTRGINLILTGRSALDARRQGRVAELEQLGANVLYAAADVSNESQMRHVVELARARFGAIDGVIHAAGVEGHGSFLTNSARQFETALAPKVSGTIVLDQVLAGEPLQFICYCASIAAVLGDFGSCDYAVGNRFQVAYAAHLAHDRAHVRRLAICWPVWQEGGMGQGAELTQRYLESSGQRALTTTEGISLFERLLRRGDVQSIVLAGQRRRVERFLGLTAKTASVVLERKSVASQARRSQHDTSGIKQNLKSILAEVLQFQAGDFTFGTSFAELGVSSINAVELMEAINRGYGLHLPTSVIFQFDSVAALAGYVQKCLNEIDVAQPEPSATELAGARAEEVSTAPMQRADREQTDGIATSSLASDRTLKQSAPVTRDLVAIVGFACRCAGARDQHEFWSLIEEGRECVDFVQDPDWLEVLKSRSLDKVVRYGAMSGANTFDSAFFGISPREAELMDPMQRVLLEVAYNAIEDAGYAPRALSEREVGVFIGAMGSSAVGADDSHFSMLGNENSILAARLSYFLDLKGPALSINTSCSSSLVAIDVACQKLQSGEIDMAIAGGITVYNTPGAFVLMHNAGMLSATGTCRPFDDAADGIVVGDGAGVVMLKRLTDAQREGDRILAVVRGIGTNQDGRTSGITVPSFLAQSRLIESVYRRNRIDVQGIQYIEAHGTATKLGDPIEVHALTEAFARFTDRKQFCGVGSLKANIGHTTAAAGVLSLIKVCLSMKQGLMPPSINCAQTNRHIDFASSPVYVNTSLKEWPVNSRGTRIAAVSSFGFSGTNAHLVMEHYAEDEVVAPAQVAHPRGAAAIPLSARDEERLFAQACRLLEHLEHRRSEMERAREGIYELAYTLQVGRDVMDCRCGFVVDSLESLCEQLRAFVARSRLESARHGSATLTDEERELIVADAIAKRRWERLLDLWVGGVNVDWNRLYDDVRPRRISLPGYAFAPREIPRMKQCKAAEPEVQEPVTSAAPPVAASALIGLQRLVPVWEPIDSQRAHGPLHRSYAGSGDGLLVIGASAKAKAEIASRYPSASFTDIAHRDETAAIGARLRQSGPVDHVLWIAPSAAVARDEDLIRAQDEGVVFAFRVIQALLLCSYGARPLAWTVVTFRTQCVSRASHVVPDHAGIHGLIGSMAKEFPQWTVRLLDLESDADWKTSRWFDVPADVRGRSWAYRSGQWHQMQLVPARAAGNTSVPYERGGVYVVIGGAGHVGAAWTEWVIRHHQAKVIWIGRRAPDSSIRRKLDRLGKLGSAPEYVVADAADRDSLQRAYLQIKRAHARIDGLVLSAIDLRQCGLAQMDERSLAEGLRAKIDASVFAIEAFAAEPLKFVVFFSSLISLVKNPEQGHYAAACAFADAYAHALSRRWAAQHEGRLVKVMNWGYWDNTAQVDADGAARLSQIGIGSIVSEEAMPALDMLLSGPLDQMGLVKTIKPLLIEGVNQHASMTIQAGERSMRMEDLKNRMRMVRAADATLAKQRVS